MSLEGRVEPQQSLETSITLIANDVADVRQMVEELGTEFGDIKILIIGDGKQPGLSEYIRAMNLKFDNHIIIEELNRAAVLAELKKYREDKDLAEADELKKYRSIQEDAIRKATLRGSLSSGGVMGTLVLLWEFLIQPFLERGR